MVSNKKKCKKFILIPLMAAVVYSLSPLVSFWLTGEVPKPKSNNEIIEELKDNKGVYFSFIVMGDNHFGLVFNDVATLKEIWHI
ncbi:MAG: hypothetical protein KAI70_00195 [Candidatus Omnitrophica bacterium]|nr:hypothetical protein [Candidatus Omnitrophota bacterium]